MQTMYGMYKSDRFQVNRRYQRKLVWSVQEKQRLIDSLIKGLPIPLFLVAEIGPPPEAPYELIDGMQRLNAIFSFVENEFSIDEGFFDLEALGDTKALKDNGQLTQRYPVMDRVLSLKIANYTIALSVFRARDSSSVDDVFRRINSGGRRLSRQELRQAGTTSKLADLVRVVSSNIRTDTSPGDVVPLQQMPNLSITNRDLSYGVDADSIFWVRHGIIRRDEVRSSQDEQLILDLVLDCLVDPLPNSGTRIRDDYYDFDEIQTDEATEESVVINNLIETYGSKKFESDFMLVYDEVRAVVEAQSDRFSALIEAGSGGRAPRYFHVIFMAFYELIWKEGMRVKDRSCAAEKLRGIGRKAINMSPRGGDWNAKPKRESVDSVKGIIRPCFEETTDQDDLGQYSWASQLETLLSNAVIEQPMFDCKQGLLALGNTRKFDETSFIKILRTLTAMSNRGPGANGFVVIGIADKPEDAMRVKQLDGIEALEYKGFPIVGVEREAAIIGKSLNEYFAWVVQRIRTHSKINQSLGRSIAADARIIGYHGRSVIQLKVVGGKSPYFFDGKLVDRLGSDTINVELGEEDYMRVFSRFTTDS